MAALRWEIEVELDGRPPYLVVADQRDIARWEVQPFGGPVSQLEAMAMTAFMFLAWSASTRQGLTDLDWPGWQGVCAGAMPVDDEDGDQAAADDVGDPGKTAIGGGSLSPSPAPVASHSQSWRHGTRVT